MALAELADQTWRWLKRNQVSREGAAMTETTPSRLNNVITIDDERIKNHLDRVVRGSVEEIEQRRR